MGSANSLFCSTLDQRSRRKRRKQLSSPRANSPSRDGAWEKQVLRPSARGKRSDATSSKCCRTALQNKQADAGEGWGSCSQGQSPVCTLRSSAEGEGCSSVPLPISPPCIQPCWGWWWQDSPGEDRGHWNQLSCCAWRGAICCPSFCYKTLSQEQTQAALPCFSPASPRLSSKICFVPLSCPAQKSCPY